jgi:guanylate kinase
VPRRDYVFVSDAEFDDLIRRDAFLEWAEVFGHRYGTPAEPVREARESGRDVIVEIDVQGARTIRQRVPDALLIFLVPPSIEELVRRLRQRGTEPDTALAERVARAEDEMAEQSWFDHVVVNDDLDRATAQVAAIIGRSRTHD